MDASRRIPAMPFAAVVFAFAVAPLLVQAARRVNAVNEIAPTDATAAAISKVAALVEEYKLVAAQAKHRKGDTPDPEPEPTPEPTPEPSGDSPVS